MLYTALSLDAHKRINMRANSRQNAELNVVNILVQDFNYWGNRIAWPLRNIYIYIYGISRKLLKVLYLGRELDM